jgi:serine/threonine protein kinase
MLAKNEVLQNRYRIIRQLGHGGMGAVYEANDKNVGSSVALKEIIIELDKIPTAKQRELFRRAFEREARLLASLHHEVFPRVMDYFSEENRQFLIMELVFGDDLGELLVKNKKPFALETALQWADHLLDALDYLHTQNPPIYHRDIKPQNLKATARGKIKLLDFGIAKSVDQAASTLTNQTFVGATLDYAPIEQILPAITPTFREFIVLKHHQKASAILSQNTDARCDIYAVGATFYHLLTNRTPVDSAKRSLEIWEGNPDPLPNPGEINADIPPPISAWLLKALEIERENRFASAIEMQKALQIAIAAAKSVRQTTEKIIVPPAPKSFSKDAENHLTEAVTENILEEKSARVKTEQKIISDTQTAPFQSSHTEPSAAQTPFPEPSVTQSLPVEVSGTSASGSISKSEFTDSPYFDEKLVEENKPAPEPVPFVEPQPEPKSGFNILLLLPIFAIGLLTVGGIGGGIIWLNRSNSTETPKPVSNTTISTPTATPTIAPTISPTLTPTSSSTDSVYYNSRGVSYDDKGEYDKAIADYTKAISIDPNYAIAYNNRAVSYKHKGEYDKAIADFTKAISIDPNDAIAYINRGVSYDDKGEYDKAIADFTKAISIMPNYADPYNNRGVSYKNKGEYDKAIADFRKALEIDPNVRKAQDNLDKVLKKKKLDMVLKKKKQD